MILKTYRIDQINKEMDWEDVNRKKVLVMDLYQEILWKDPWWHFFFDWDGGTLRFSPKFEKKFRRWAKKQEGFRIKRRKSWTIRN